MNAAEQIPHPERCPDCARSAPGGRVMSGPRHGTRARYTAGCGCADCTAASTWYMRERRRREGPGRVLEAANRRRQYHRQQLAMRWLREHRPDVWAEVCDEAWRLVEAEQQREAS